MFDSPSPVAGAVQRGERRRRGAGDPLGEILERCDAAVVAARRHVGHEDQPLAPVVEHHGAIDREERDRWARRLAGVGRWVSVERRRFVGDGTHQAARERRRVEAAGHGPSGPRRSARPAATYRRRPRARLADGVLDPEPGVVEHKRRGRIARDER